MAWRLARSLVTLRDEINAAAPSRSKKSDGTIGDEAHASRVSDHNPNSKGVVRAFDVTHDPRAGVDCNVLADRIIGRFGQIPALTSGAYVIWQGRIWSYDKRHLGWRDSSGHDKHMHVSVATAAAGYDSTQPWGIAAAAVQAIATPREELDPMLYIAGNNYVVLGHNGGWATIAYTPNDKNSEYVSLVNKLGPPTWVNPQTLNHLIEDSRGNVNSTLLAEVRELVATEKAAKK